MRETRTALKPSTSQSVRVACLLACALVSTHAGLVGAGQTARMYALAALMAAVTAWLVLRALHDVPGGRRWWWAYGLGVSGMLYAHHYAWFTLAAQLIFVLGVVARRGMNNPREGLQTAGGLLLALGLALALYSPWLLVFLAQTHRVREGFWVPAASAHETWWQFLKWLTGLEYLTPVERWGFVGVLGASAVWRVARRDAAAIFFLLQAAVPWAATLAISAWGGRPLLQDRYLVMAQVALVAYLGVVFARCLGSRTPSPADDPAVPTRSLGSGHMLGVARICGSRLREDLGLVAALMWAWLRGVDVSVFIRAPAILYPEASATDRGRHRMAEGALSAGRSRDDRAGSGPQHPALLRVTSGHERD